MQDQLVVLVDRTRPAVVGVEVVFENENGNSVGSASGSGVIIDSELGLILTAGHVGRAANLSVKVYLHDGTRLSARTLGQHLDGQEDCGLIIINGDDIESLKQPLTALKLGDSDMVQAGDWVLAFGHALGIQKFPWRPPPARIGCITSNYGHVLTMDAPLNGGDSGGPLLDMNGNVIGINESCARHPFQNAATAISVAIDKMPQMLQGISSGATLPNSADNFELENQNKGTRPLVYDEVNPNGGRNAPAVRAAFADASWDAADWIVRVFGNGREIALGLVVDASGLAVTKATEIDPRLQTLQVSTSVGTLADATVIGHDSMLDLLLLQLPPGEWKAVPFDDAVVPDAGAWLVSPGPDAEPIGFGIRELDEYVSALSNFDKAFLGVRSDRFNRGKGALIQQVVPGTAARLAGVQPGDRIMSIDGEPVEGPRGLLSVLGAFHVGDVVELKLERNGKHLTTTVRLGERQGATLENATGNRLIGVNRRDSGFGSVVQHDALLPPEKCGGPVVDLDGRFVGMNIARSDRTRNYAVPAAILRASVDHMRTHGKTEKGWRAIDPRDLQVPIRMNDDGTITLPADDAQVFGPSLRYETPRRGDGYIGNWLTDRDEVLWVLENPEPGAYEVRIIQACPRSAAGGAYSVSANREAIQATVNATGGARDFEEVLIGTLELGSAKRLVLRIKPNGNPTNALMNLRSVELIPVFD